MAKDVGNDVLIEEVVTKTIASGGVVIGVGAMEPQCEMTNLALLLASGPKNKVNVIINSIPCGPGIPEEIRRGWIGVVINGTHGPFTTWTNLLVNGDSEKATFTKGYAVDTLTALESLKKANMNSWNWFVGKKLPGHFFFNEECCQIIP